MSFQLKHISLLLRYSGISGVAGAVNHGFFSEERSFVTATIGVALYLVGAFLDHRNHLDENDDWKHLFGFGILSSIGLGFFTGGIQHFPDSPHRSLWVVPTGFILSVAAFYMLEGQDKIDIRSFLIYSISAALIVLIACIGASEIIEYFGIISHSH